MEVMKTLIKQATCHALRFARVHMLVGLAILTGAMFLVITGKYENLASRQHAESLLHTLALAGLLYTVVFWCLKQFVRPLPVAGRCRARIIQTP